MPLSIEDVTPTDISGDPPPVRPLTQKQMKGAQSAQVNRTQLPAGGHGPAGEKPQQQQNQTPDQTESEAGKVVGGGPQVAPDVPILGGLQQMQNTIQSEAEQVLGINPAHGQDWWQRALESPLESYFLGKHMYNAYFGAFLDPRALEASVHDLWHQDSAVGQLTRWQGEHSAMAAVGMTQPNIENLQAGGTGTVLPITADPSNLLYAGPARRGAELVAKFLTPAATRAIFTDKHTPTDLAWGVLPALIFGGRLPPSVTAQVEKIAPGAVKLLEKFSAAKLAQEANKNGLQDRQQLLQKVIREGTMPEMRKVLAQGWNPNMKPLSREQEINLGKSLLDKYGSLDRDSVIPQMIKEGASLNQIKRVWTKLLRMPYPLLHIQPEELPLINPVSYLHELPGAARKEAEDGVHWMEHMIQQAHLGPAGHDADPAVSRFRSLIGLQSTNDLTQQMWTDHLRRMAGTHADNPAEQNLLMRALEGDNTAYLSLAPEMKVVRDEMRGVAAGMRMAGQEAGSMEGAVPNYWPRVGLLIKEKGGFRAMRGAPQLLSRAPVRHRAVGVVTKDYLTETRMQVEQLYKSVEDANDAVKRHRGLISEGILNGTPWHELDGVPETDGPLVERIHAIAQTDAEVAKLEAEHYAESLIPEFSTNPFAGISKLGRDMRGLTSYRAVEDLLNSVGKGGRALAVLRPQDDHAIAALRAQGYRPIGVRGFDRVLVDNQYGKLLEDATRHRSLGAFQKAADVENAAVAMIMFSPRIHGMNMAARLGMAWMQHPLEVSRWFGQGLLQKGGLSQFGLKGVSVVGHEQYRMIPRRYGLVPPNPHVGGLKGGFADSYISSIGKLFGDEDMQRVPLLRDMANSNGVAKASSGAKQVLGKTRDLLWGRQSDLWSWVSDFGNMMWWIEYASARRGGLVAKGLEHEEAARYATARANSWMGHVSPADWNPNLHAALKTVTFAPNWWRTWGELLTGYYRNQGFGWSKNTISYVVENEIKTLASAVLFQQMSSNVLNMVLGGHTTYQNDPGNWGRVEVTAPWAIDILNETVFRDKPIDPKTGRDAQGRKLTIENPFARQMKDTEDAMGLLTSAPQWSPDTFRTGFSQFLAARESPLASALAALGNVDLYRSISSDGIRYVDPNHDTLFGNPVADFLTATLALTPFSYVSQQIQQAAIQGNVQQMQGPFGVPIPKAVADSFNPGALAGDAARSMLVGMTGVNPPYMRSSKTEGISPTDDQYKAVHELQTTYEQRMTALSTSSLSGQMAPYQWLATYRQLSMQHAAQMQAIFKHAPEYNNGPLGLVNSWENLYDQSTDATGTLQPDQLRAAQQQWRNTHSAAEYQAVQNELRVNDTKYPMLQLYHKTLDAYDNWQSEWAQANNIDLATLQSDISGYNKVYRDRTASQAWLRDHPDITQFNNAKRNEFEAGQSHYGEAGLMYALFFNPSAADRYLLTSGETAQQVEQAVQQQQVPPAP